MALNCSAELNPIDPGTVSIKYIVGGWLTLIFCLFGIITNIFTVVVLLHPRMRNSSTHVYLMAMSVCNIFLLAGLMINYSLKSIATYPELLNYLHRPDETNRNALLANSYEQFYARVAPFTTPLLSMLLLCSTYLTVLVSGDRYFLICWPLIAEKLRTRTMAFRLVFLIIILVNIYILPHWFEYKTKFKPLKSFTLNISNQSSIIYSLINNNNKTNVRLAELSYTALGSNPVYLSIYRFYLNVPVTFVIPFSLLAICNGSMIHKLVLIKQKKKRLGHRMKADIRITTMLIVIVLTFMLCRSANLLVNLLVQLSPCLNKNSLQRLNTFANLLIAFNGFVNFFLFAAFGQRFREMVLYIFFRHGQHPFFGPLDGVSGHRGGGTQTNTPETSRRQSRRFSANDSDLLAAISRRRSSATMAVLYNPSDVRPRSSSHSQSNSSPSQWSSRLHIPTFLNGGHHHNKKRISNSSVNVTESPFLNSSYLNLPAGGNGSIATSLHVPTAIQQKNPSPSCIKKRTTSEIQALNGSSTPHHVKFV